MRNKSFIIIFLSLTLLTTCYAQESAVSSKNNIFSMKNFSFKDLHYLRFLLGNSKDSIEPFKSDGCSSFPDGNPLKNKTMWQHCCVAHDYAYWVGGKEELRVAADKELGHCVGGEVSKELGKAMEFGVVAGGIPAFFPLAMSYRWAYGWDYVIGYEEMSEVQKKSIASHLNSVINDFKTREANFSVEQNDYIKKHIRSLIVEYTEYMIPSKQTELINLLD
jgi:hypothetical protein